ncbi:RGG repeats nuclear RNA binding protein A-like [Tasmannia lanceolata]|uniref:RGG repeats nuclear RNA binding protein A-like n=1 Tax=Tasmannia lanceolata TaxID=3420 RepID=UPI0040637CE1
MATVNPFDLLGDDDNDDPAQLIAKQQLKVPAPAKTPAPSKTPATANLPSKPPPPSQAVKEARNNAEPALRGGDRGRGGGGGRGRGGRGGGPGVNKDFGSNGNVNGFSGGYDGGEDGEVNKALERERGTYGPPRQSFRGGGGRRGGYGDGEGGGRRGGYRDGEGGGRRGGYRDGEVGEDSERPPRRQFERHSRTGRGPEMKRDGAGRGNWGTPTDQVIEQEPEEIPNTEDKVLTPEKQLEQEDAPTSDAKEVKESPVNEVEEKEPEDKEMTLEEYQKVLEEKRKSLLAMKAEERKVDFDKEFESMQQLSIKKGNDEIFIKLGSDKDLAKRKENAERDERVKKSLSINEFLKPAEGGRYYSPGGRGRGRGRGDRGERGQFRGGFHGGSTSTVVAPSIEDPGQFPTLGGK